MLGIINNESRIYSLSTVTKVKMAWFIRFSDKDISVGNYCPNFKTLSFTSLNLKRGRIPSNLINSCPMKLIMADRMGQILGKWGFVRVRESIELTESCKYVCYFLAGVTKLFFLTQDLHLQLFIRRKGSQVKFTQFCELPCPISKIWKQRKKWSRKGWKDDEVRNGKSPPVCEGRGWERE